MHLPTLSSQAARAARACAIALGFAIPISAALDNVLLAAILALWLASVDYRAKLALLSRHRVALAALSLFGLFVIGLAWGEHDTAVGLHMLGKYIDLAFVPIFVTLFQTERDRRRALLALAAALVLTLTLSYLMWIGIVASGTFAIGYPGDLWVFKKSLTQNILMAFGAFLFAHFALHAQSSRSRILWSALALLAAVNVLVLVPGRTGQLILAVLAVYFAYSARRWRGALFATSGIAIVVAALALGLAPANSRLMMTLEDWNKWQPDHAAQASASTLWLRLEFYRNSLAIIRDHPVIGVGTGGFAKAYAGRVAWTDMTDSVNPHNEYMNIAIQLGAVGLVALLYLFYCQWRLAPELPTAFESHLARGLIITIALGCLFNSLLMDHVEGLFFAWAAGVLFAGLKSPPATTGDLLSISEMVDKPFPLDVPLSLAGEGLGVRDRASSTYLKPDSAMTLSVVVITRNEAAVIARCLESVTWADEIVVLDSESGDGTPDIARRFNAKIETSSGWPGFGPQKNRALDLASGDWILSLDADEWVTPALRAAIERAIAVPDGNVAFRMPRLSSYCGRFMRHSGWWPDHVTRLFRRGQARFSGDLVHERLIVNGAVGTLREPLLHEAIRDLDEALVKMNAYSTAGAMMQSERGKKASLAGAVWHGAWTFFRTYVLRAGFLDGREGFMLAVSNAEGAYYRYLKLMLLREKASD